MTMHLLGPAFTTISTRKRKSKGTTVNAKFAKEFIDYNKQMKKLGANTKTLEEYIAYRKGKSKGQLRGTAMPEYKRDNHREQYPSGDGIGVTFARKENVYTGDKIIGVAVLHKSCLQPVSSRQDAEDIARMRRG